MRFLVDAQLPPALARWLEDRGHQAEHVEDRGLASASDREIWDLALEIEAVIVTKDEDFVSLRTLRAAVEINLHLWGSNRHFSKA